MRLIYEVISGSTLYGLSTGEGDTDTIGFFIEEAEEILGLSRKDTVIERTQPEGTRSGAGDVDRTLYGLRKFALLCAKGNPATIEALYAARTALTNQCQGIIDLANFRSLFVNLRTCRAHLGYMLNQRDRLLGKRGGKVKRPELVQQFGYDTKFAMHALRIGYQGIDLINNGTLFFPLANGRVRDHLLAVRRGLVSNEDVLKEINYISEELSWMIKENSFGFPKESDAKKVDSHIVNAYVSCWEDSE